MKAFGAGLVGGLAVCFAVGLFVVGCDTTKTTDSVLTVSPPSATLTGAGATATFTVSVSGSNTTVALPLVWAVSDASLGNIKAAAGVSAVYESTGKVGSNIITVRDQGQDEGLATVTQN